MKEAEFIEKCKKVIEKYKMKVDIAELTAVLRTMVDYLKRYGKRLKYIMRPFVFSKKNEVTVAVAPINGIPHIIVYRVMLPRLIFKREIYYLPVAWLTDKEVEFTDNEATIEVFVSAFEDPVYL